VDAILVPIAYTAEGTMRSSGAAIRVPSMSAFQLRDGGLAPILSIPVTALQLDMRLMGKCAIVSLHSLLAGSRLPLRCWT
jgi:DNA-binding LacI/PurR family transcriptional regulator